MRRSEIPEIVVQFHGAPQKVISLKLKVNSYAYSCNEIVI